MDDQTVKSRKKVSFGKARVRLVFDYYNQESTQSEDTDEKTSREIAKMKQKPSHPQKQPKSILKPSTRAVSVDSGLNALHRVPKRNFEWGKMDKNFWEPANHKRNGKRRQGSPNNRELENRDTTDKNDLLKKDDKSVAKQENNTNFSEGEMNMASNKNESAKDEPSTEKPAVKNNEKWEGITASYPQGLSTTSPTFVGIYSGVEADWDQTSQSLSRIGVDVGEHRLQNPREFVAIMNMLLSVQKEKSDNQTVRGTEQDSIVVDHTAEMHDSNNNGRRVREQKTIPQNPVFYQNEEDPVIKEELMSAKLGATHKSQKAAISKEELKKRIKKLKMKGFIPGKKENTSRKIRKENSYSKGNLNYLPITDCKVTNYEEHSSFDRFRSRMEMNSSNSSSNNSKFEKEKRRDPKGSTSEGNLDSVSKFEVEKTGKRDDCSSVEDLSCDIEAECSSTDSSSTTYKDSSDTHFYSDNNLDLPKRISLDDGSRRDRSFSCAREGGSGLLGEDLKHKRERQKVVKRDSWFLTRKQKMKGESEERSNLKEENLKEGREVTEGNDKGGGIDLEKQFKIRAEITQRKPCGNNSERRCGKITQKKSSVEVQEASTSGSEFENRNKSSKQKAESESSPKLDDRSDPKDGQNRKRESAINSESQLKMTQRKKHSDQVKEDSTSGSELDNGNKSSKPKDHKNKQTLLTISNLSELEKEDSGLSTSASVETISGPGNEQSTSNIVQNHNENTNKAEHLDANDSIKQSETNRTIGNHENFEITSKNEEHTKSETTQTRTDSINGNNQNSNEDEFLVNKKFLNDLWFIVAEAKRSLRSEEYLERARKRYRPKRNSCLETNLALKVMGAISKNPAAGILLPFSN